MAVTSEMVKTLREMTGAGMLDCKKALDLHAGDMDKAVEFLKEKGLAAAVKKASREANEGKIEIYAHQGGRMAVIVEVNCETDFVARTPEFKELAHDIAIQIASTGPTYVRREDISAETLAEQTARFAKEYIEQGKKPEIAARAAQGKVDAWIKEVVLMEQAFVKDDAMTISELVKNGIAKIGENVVIRRFTRYQLGGE
ncbi:MAG: translation elongation factor Ts [Thermoflexales bacterium]|nr:translation elongation factor Ts [Thermoflexales bacterium]